MSIFSSNFILFDNIGPSVNKKVTISKLAIFQ